MPCENIVKAKVSGVEVKFPGLESDGCKNPEINCPLIEGSIVSYQVSFTIPAISDKMYSESTFEMFDERSQLLVCLKVPFEISMRSARKSYRIKYIA
ncbi:hypothetical protein MXB_3708 [Myxobolus squamalis]|nr:hypothetical protein MXB_3708 [Myxobolus squamalis]